MTEEKKETQPAKTPPPDPKKAQQRKRWIVILAIIFITLGFLYLLYYICIARFYESTDDAYVSGNLVQVMPEISGHVTRIYADETALVQKGDPLVALERTDAEVALRNAESNLALTVRQVSQLYQTVEQLKANVQLQQANLLKAQDDYKRRAALVVTKVISSEDLEHAKIAVEAAETALSYAKHSLDAAIALVSNSNLYQHPQVKQAEDRLRNAYLTWLRTKIYSPETGFVAKRPVQVGQEVNPNTVLMVIVPLNQVWVDANFKESQLANMRIGQPAEVVADAYGSAVKFKGKVVGLSPGTGSSFDLLPPQNATGNWIKIVQRLPVRISIDAEQLKKYPLRVGLSVTVTANTHDRKGGSLTLPTKPNTIIYETTGEGEALKEVDLIINNILQTNAKNVSYPATN